MNTLHLLLAGSTFGAAGESLVTGDVETVREGFRFTEGPVWLPEGRLVFSDIPADTIYAADGSVVRWPSGKSNGLTLDTEGRLVACEHGNRRVSRTERDGTVTTVADAYEGKRLNSPNDVVVRSDGTIIFTDPPYGLEGRPAELDVQGVYAISPAGQIRLIADDFTKPNGLTFSPDESVLYIADTEHSHIRAFDVAPDGTLSNARVFCEVERPDGMKTDRDGRIWTTAADGMEVFAPDGARLAALPFPQRPANCAFGDDDGKTLYVTARTGLYRVRCASEGIRPATRVPE